MKHEDKIKRMIVRIEFDCYGREAWIEVMMNLYDLMHPLETRAKIDDSIARFLNKHKPLGSLDDELKSVEESH